eukprot:6184718-Pleurochrysis_carterae.AAC.3
MLPAHAAWPMHAKTGAALIKPHIPGPHRNLHLLNRARPRRCTLLICGRPHDKACCAACWTVGSYTESKHEACCCGTGMPPTPFSAPPACGPSPAALSRYTPRAQHSTAQALHRRCRARFNITLYCRAAAPRGAAAAPDVLVG